MLQVSLRMLCLTEVGSDMLNTALRSALPDWGRLMKFNKRQETVYARLKK